MIFLIVFSILMFFAMIKTLYDQRKEKEEYKRLQQAAQSLANQERKKDYKRFSDEFQSVEALYDNICYLQSYVEKEYQTAVKRGDDDLIQKYLAKMISLDKQIISLRKKLNKLYDYEEKHF